MDPDAEEVDKSKIFALITPVGSMEAAQNFVRYFQVFQYLIPISLYVTVELMKSTQAYFIMTDYRMVSVKRER